MIKYLYTLLFCFFFNQTYSQPISGIVNTYRKVLWVDSSTGRVRLSNVSGFAAFVGYKAMLIQMKGATMNGGTSVSDANFGNITAINNAGNYEIGTICGFLNDTLVFERKLNNYYDVNGLVQCVIIPKYTNAIITDTLRALAWDSTAGTGGIIAIQVTGLLTLNKPIDASGSGFRGPDYVNFIYNCPFTPGIPDYYMSLNTTSTPPAGAKKGEGIAGYITNKEYGRGKQTNGGGGGNYFNAGGAGGSNYGTGGLGGLRINGACQSNSPAVGGLSLSTYYSQGKIFLGGGGGAGHGDNDYGMGGGHGGGIVYILADSIKGASSTASDNKIMADGARPYRYLTPGICCNASGSDGSGGGGGGGVVIINSPVMTGTITIEAAGAKGGDSENSGLNQCSGPAGGGGGGVIYLKPASTPVNVTLDVSGGANGTTLTNYSSCNHTANSATSGTNGAAFNNFQLATPKDSSTICQGLVSIQLIVLLTGNQQNDKTFLTAAISDSSTVSTCILQKAITNNDFIDVAAQTGTNLSTYHFVDPYVSYQVCFYRVKIITRSGTVAYSPVLRFAQTARSKKLLVDIFPNPAKDNISLNVYSGTPGFATIELIDPNGRRLVTLQHQLIAGINNIPVSTGQLAGGIYIVRIVTPKENASKAFMKLSH